MSVREWEGKEIGHGRSKGKTEVLWSCNDKGEFGVPDYNWNGRRKRKLKKYYGDGLVELVIGNENAWRSMVFDVLEKIEHPRHQTM